MRISRHTLDEQILIKIYQLFFKVLSRFDDQDEFFQLFDDILYPTEKIMLAKRVAILYLLLKKIPQENIAKTLKVSTGTVSRFSILFYNKETRIVTLLKHMITKEHVLDFLDDVFADLFIQPGVKIDHWQMYWDHKRKRERRKNVGI